MSNTFWFFTLRCRVNRPLALEGRWRWWQGRWLSQSMLKIVLNLVPEAICVLVKVHYGISEGYWTKPGPKSTLVVVLLLVLVFQNCPKTGSRSYLNAVKVHNGISEGHWTKPGPKSTLVVFLLLVLVFQNCP